MFRLSPIELTAYTLPGRKLEAKFALDCARRALHYYADLFQMEYPMKKLDLVAVPDLFYPAMENWALILFKVRATLFFRFDFSVDLLGRGNVDQRRARREYSVPQRLSIGHARNRSSMVWKSRQYSLVDGRLRRRR